MAASQSLAVAVMGQIQLPDATNANVELTWVACRLLRAILPVANGLQDCSTQRRKQCQCMAPDAVGVTPPLQMQKIRYANSR